MQKWKENKQKYNAEYNKENTVAVLIRLNKKTESDIIERLESVENKNAFLKNLIREEMLREKHEYI